MSLLECADNLIHKAFTRLDSLQIEYDVDEYLQDMISLNAAGLQKWRSGYAAVKNSGIHALDVLYHMTDYRIQ